jgi:glycosyltransferase involved in cell wall biosynthesis
MSKPKVSVISITYNHEKYIREALDGFVAQKTDFNIEVIVADDASTDKTPSIIREYAKKYPNVFKPILREKNIGAVKNFYGAIRAAKGNYIALCEGDDYWTNPRKLQIQANFMDRHPKYAICFHSVRVFFEEDEVGESIFPATRNRTEFTIESLLNDNYIQTNSVMYRAQDYQKMPEHILPLDWYLHLYHAQFGKIGFINEVMSAYRRHPEGLWWSAHNNKIELWRRHGLPHFALFVELMKLYGEKDEYRKIIAGWMYKVLLGIVEVEQKYGASTLKEVLSKYPDSTIIALLSMNQDIAYWQDRVSSAGHMIELKENHIQNLEAQLRQIQSNRAWQVAQSFGKIKKNAIDAANRLIDRSSHNNNS